MNTQIVIINEKEVKWTNSNSISKNSKVIRTFEGGYVGDWFGGRFGQQIKKSKLPKISGLVYKYYSVSVSKGIEFIHLVYGK